MVRVASLVSAFRFPIPTPSVSTTCTLAAALFPNRILEQALRHLTHTEYTLFGNTVLEIDVPEILRSADIALLQ